MRDWCSINDCFTRYRDEDTEPPACDKSWCPVRDLVFKNRNTARLPESVTRINVTPLSNEHAIRHGARR